MTPSDRNARLFACRCVRQIENLLIDPRSFKASKLQSEKKRKKDAAYTIALFSRLRVRKSQNLGKTMVFDWVGWQKNQQYLTLCIYCPCTKKPEKHAKV
jgi:hypothetical protein